MTQIEGERVRLLREAHRWSQRQLAAIVATTPQEICRLEKGQRPGASAATVARIAQALGTSADYLMGLTADVAPPAPHGLSTGDPGRLVRLQRLVESISQLTQEDQDRVIDAVLTLIEVKGLERIGAAAEEKDALRAG